MRPRFIGHRYEYPFQPDPQSWAADAACLDHDPETFFPHPSDRDGEDAAVAVCWQCPVEQQCLADAMQAEKGLSVSNRWGIWGGKTPQQRYAMHRSQTRESKGMGR